MAPLRRGLSPGVLNSDFKVFNRFSCPYIFWFLAAVFPGRLKLERGAGGSAPISKAARFASLSSTIGESHLQISWPESKVE